MWRHLKVANGSRIEDGVASDLAKDGVLLVQPGGCIQRDEELAAIGVRLLLAGACNQSPANFSWGNQSSLP